jgi:hypothetical protein
MIHSPTIFEVLEEQAKNINMPFDELLKVYACAHRNKKFREILLVKPNKR